MSAGDRIAALVTEREEMARKHPEHAASYLDPAQLRSIANSVAIGRAANPVMRGQAYSALIATAHAWWPRAGRASTPESDAAFTCEHFPHAAEQKAQLADAVADYIEASAADLRDDGATASAWRRHARALRGEVIAP